MDPALPRDAVTTRRVRTISRKGSARAENPQRLYAELRRGIGDETVRSAWRHAEWVANPTLHDVERNKINGPKVAIAALEKSDQMLEPLENPPVLRQESADTGSEMTSENPRGVSGESREPDDQQERLVDPNWVTGFVDGEGCFSIGFVRQPSRTSRKGYKTGYQVTHDFAVVQGARSVLVLHDLRRFFGCGAVYMNRRHDNHRENMHLYSVHRRADLLEKVIPFFERYPLRTSKAQDFAKFVRCLEIIAADGHLTYAGLIEIAEIAETMNRRKPRTELIRILRDHTSDG